MIELPNSFRAQPRWWHDQAGQAWLDELPALVAAQCERWGLDVDGAVRHGSNALVVPVRRGSEPLALRLGPPGDDVGIEVAALRFWAGRGTVLVVDVDETRGASLLERLDATRTLADLPLAEAVESIGRLARRLAVPVPPTAASWIRSTAEVLTDELAGFPAASEAAGRPLPDRMLAAVLESGLRLAEIAPPPVAVNGDLHFDQVLAGQREPWLVVDPVLLRGDVAYDFGRVLWSRLDEMPDDRAVHDHLDRLTGAAEVDREHARRWVVHRAASYLFWGLRHGLTEDPPRCHRLLDLFL